MKNQEPSSGWSSMVFLPIQPRPARAARSRSSTGPVSTYPLLARAARFGQVSGELGEARSDDVVVVTSPRVAGHR